MTAPRHSTPPDDWFDDNMGKTPEEPELKSLSPDDEPDWSDAAGQNSPPPNDSSDIDVPKVQPFNVADYARNMVVDGLMKTTTEEMHQRAACFQIVRTMMPDAAIDTQLFIAGWIFQGTTSMMEGG